MADANSGFDLGSFLSSALSLYGQNQASNTVQSGQQTAYNAVDPWGASGNRAKASTQLSDFMANPSSALQTPEAQAAFKYGTQAVNTSNAAQGFTGSGQGAVALQNYGMSQAQRLINNRFNQLNSLAGTNNGQLAGAEYLSNQAGAKATNQLNNTQGSALGNLLGQGGKGLASLLNQGKTAYNLGSNLFDVGGGADGFIGSDGLTGLGDAAYESGVVVDPLTGDILDEGVGDVFGMGGDILDEGVGDVFGMGGDTGAIEDALGSFSAGSDAAGAASGFSAAGVETGLTSGLFDTGGAAAGGAGLMAAPAAAIGGLAAILGGAALSLFGGQKGENMVEGVFGSLLGDGAEDPRDTQAGTLQNLRQVLMADLGADPREYGNKFSTNVDPINTTTGKTATQVYSQAGGVMEDPLTLLKQNPQLANDPWTMGIIKNFINTQQQRSKLAIGSQGGMDFSNPDAYYGTLAKDNGVYHYIKTGDTGVD